MNNIIEQLGFSNKLLSSDDVIKRYPRYADITCLGVDQFYFIDGHPAALFYRTENFEQGYCKDVSEILHNAWNYNKILLLITYSKFEVRVYNCHCKPNYVSNNSEYREEIKKAQIAETQDSSSDLQHFTALFSREALDTGALWSDNDICKKIDLSKRIDAYLADSLNRTKDALSKRGLDEEFIHSLLIRSLFILFLEDKGATQEAGIYTSILPNSKSYFDILKNKEATYKLFSRLSEHFKGDITNVDPNEKEQVRQEHLELIRKCFLDGDLSDNPKLFGDWRLFKFNIIRVELLSEIYEIFLGKAKAQKGQFYTPAALADLVLDEMLPLDSNNWEVKILDPTCGSGIFLVKGYKRLIYIWEKTHNEDSIDFDSLKYILCNYIYGIDIDYTSLSVASFSLYLALVDELNPKTLWSNQNVELPYLIHTGEENEKVDGNLWCKDTIATDFTQLISHVDIVVGNPPYGLHHKQESIKKYCNEHNFANEMSLPFIHKATFFCPNGKIGLVVNMKIFTNTEGTYKRFRRWLLKDAYIEKVYNFSIFRKATNNYGGSLFSSASTPVAVVFFKSSRPNKISHSIVYWAPKTYVKSNLLSDIVFDNCDLKYLPRELCEDENSYIWKIGAWGNRLAYNLVHRLLLLPNLSSSFKSNDWIFGRGCNADSKHPDFIPNKLLNLNFSRYSIDNEAIIPNNKSFRNAKQGLFNSPYVVVKECPDKEGVVSAIYQGDAVTTTSTFVLNGMSYEDKIVLVCFLNSKLTNVFLFLITSTWGIERERLLLEDEMMKLPSPFVHLTSKQKSKIVSLYNQICQEQAKTLPQSIDGIKEQINTIIYNIFNLSKLDVEIVDDIYSNSFSLFALKEKADALKKTREVDIRAYADRLCKNMNEYFQYSSTKVYRSYLKPIVYDPLAMVTIQLGSTQYCDVNKSTQQVRQSLKLLYNNENIKSNKESNDIVIQRVFRIYGKDNIIIIKPNQRRYWTTMQAVEDSASIFSDILSMNSQKNG